MRNLLGSMVVAWGLLVCGLADAAPQQEREVTATGEAAVLNGDVPSARRLARNNALRSAVEQTLGTTIVSDTETREFETVKDRVLAVSDGFVKSYEVVSESEEGGTVVSTLRAVVLPSSISAAAKAAQLAYRQANYPRMAVLVAEQHINQSAPVAWWGPQGAAPQAGGVLTVDQRLVENALIGAWTDVGFSFVDMDALAGKIRGASVVSTNPSANQIRELANLSDADVILVGTAVATRQGDVGQFLGDKSGEMKMVSCVGMVNVRAFNSDSGEILATSDARKVKVNVNELSCGSEALQEAARVVAQDLRAKIVTSWSRRTMGASRVRMQVKGVDSFRTLSELKNALATALRGVRGVDQKSFGNGKADLDLRLDGGDTEALAGELDGRAVGKLKVRVVGYTPNTIDIELAK